MRSKAKTDLFEREEGGTKRGKKWRDSKNVSE